MKIDWKQVSKSKGYISLKGCMFNDLTERQRSKQVLLFMFDWVISRAKYYAHKEQVTLDVILDKWEEERDCWWLSYYQEGKQPKIKNAPNVYPLGIRGVKLKDKRGKWRSAYVCRLIREKQMLNSKRVGNKARWPEWRKEQQIRLNRHKQRICKQGARKEND